MKVSQFMPFLDNKEYESIKECFDTNWFTEGPKSREFCKRLCDLVGSKYGVLAPNGTLSLFLGLKALGIGPGDEVLVPDFTFIASATSIHMAGATPVFVDCNKDTLHIDISKCQELTTEKTKAIMPAHMYGMSCDMDEVVTFAKKNNLKIIEDAAQTIGVNWNGKPCGTFGDVGSWSFFADKTITTIEGGFLATNDEEIYNKLLHLRNHGRVESGTFVHPQIGWNFRITDIQAAIGLVQLEKLPYIIERKQEIFKIYEESLKDINQIHILKPISGSNHVPFRFSFYCEGHRDELTEFLSNNGVEPRTFFYPMHKQPCFSFLESKDKFTNSTYAFDNGICLPTYPSLKDEQVHYICDLVRSFFK